MLDNAYYDLSLGDMRLNKVLLSLISSMVSKLSIVFRHLAANRKDEVSYHRLWHNKKLTAEKIIEAAVSKTSDLVKDSAHVLVIHDTTEISLESAKNGRRDLGYVGHDLKKGFKIHPSLVVDAELGNCLGISSFYFWRKMEKKSEKKGKKHRNKLPIENKESIRWLDNAESSKANLGPQIMKTIIADRESDIYEVFYRVPDDSTHLIIRSCYDRKLSSGWKLHETLDRKSIADTFSISLPAITGKRKHRIAKLNLKYGSVSICKTEVCKDRDAPKSIVMNVVEVIEVPETVPMDEEGIHWILLTTHAISSTKTAKQIVEWYKQRWNIEQFFRTLKKQGLQVESCQVKTYDCLVKIVLMASLAALQCMQLVLARNKDLDLPMIHVFEESDKEFMHVINTHLRLLSL